MKEYIERKEALRQIFLEAMGHDFDFNAEYRKIYISAKRAVRNTPAADVIEVRHAKWDDEHKCTACGNEALLEEKPDTLAHGLNSLFFVDSDYCPNCGACMDKEDA